MTEEDSTGHNPVTQLCCNCAQASLTIHVALAGFSVRSRWKLEDEYQRLLYRQARKWQRLVEIFLSMTDKSSCHRQQRTC